MHLNTSESECLAVGVHTEKDIVFYYIFFKCVASVCGTKKPKRKRIEWYWIVRQGISKGRFSVTAPKQNSDLSVLCYTHLYESH
jgi:hypothetical protein